ncbi:MAG: ribosome maturation factor RimP [Gemmatimonadota bacterium]|nr:ribosome maturation factor RimP [Gemmatimonadota bacterium]
MPHGAMEQEIEAAVEGAGFEVVELERAGTPSRPILRLRIDRTESTPGAGVTLDDCSAVHRALRPLLDARPELSSDYALEVSSPGVERPLVRRSDWERFAGEEVALRGRDLAGRGRRLEGTLLGISPAEGGDRVRLRLSEGGDEVEVALAGVTRAHLLHRWNKPERPR